MPRNGSGVYSPPPAYNVQAGDTVETSQYVPIIEDIQADLNAARPVSSGGTGATSKSGARDSLQVASKILSKSANYTLSVDDRGQVIRGTANLTLTLPTVATAGDGFVFTVIADGGDVTVDGNGSETIDGATTLVVDDGARVDFYCNGTAWFSSSAGTILIVNPGGDRSVITQNSQGFTIHVDPENNDADNSSFRVYMQDQNAILTANAGVTNVAGDLVVEGSGNQTYRASISGTGGVAETIIGVTSDLGGSNFRTLVLLSPDTNDATTPWRFNDPVTFDGLFLSDSQVYARSNILDPVSQSGGVPTGGVVESGNGANGSYTKFADGTMICRHVLIGSNSADTTWTYPEAFAASPTVMAQALDGGPRFATTRTRGPTSVGFSVYNTSGTRQANFCELLAVGDWF